MPACPNPMRVAIIHQLRSRIFRLPTQVPRSIDGCNPDGRLFSHVEFMAMDRCGVHTEHKVMRVDR